MTNGLEFSLFYLSYPKIDSCFIFAGAKKIMLFVEKVNKDDIQVHFSYKDPIGMYSDPVALGQITEEHLTKEQCSKKEKNTKVGKIDQS